MNNKYVSVSLFTRPGKFDVDWRKKEVDFINSTLFWLSSTVKQSEILVTVHDNRSLEYFSSQQFNVVDNVEIRFVSTTKLSKTYSKHNLGHRAAIGDIICHFDMSSNIEHVSPAEILKFDELDQYHIIFIVDHSITRSNRLYYEMNCAYQFQIIPDGTQGFVVTRQALNIAFNIETQTYDPFIALGLSGLLTSTRSITHLEKPDSKRYDRYSKRDLIELLLVNTNESGINEIRKYYYKVMLVVYALSIVGLYNYLSKLPHAMMFVLFITFAIICRLVEKGLAYLEANYILNKHILAAAKNKQLVGQLNITNYQSSIKIE